MRRLMSGKVDDSDRFAQLVSRLQKDLRMQAWAIVGAIVRAECERRSAVLTTLELAFDAALAKPRAPSTSARASGALASVESPADRSSSVLEPKPAGTQVMAAIPIPAATPPDPPPDPSRTIGTVKWFNETKGFGFIVAPDGADVFVHYAHVAGEGFRTLAEGATVSYLAREGPRGRFATDVRLAQRLR